MQPLIHVMAPYWEHDREERTADGALVAAAKDHADPDALARLCERVAAWAAGLDLPPAPVVVPVPPDPARRSPVPAALAAAVASGLAVAVADVVVATRSRPPARHVDPAFRSGIVDRSGYEVVADVAGRNVVLVDDVVLTGTTLRCVADALATAGAKRVDALAVCRTRRG